MYLLVNYEVPFKPTHYERIPCGNSRCNFLKIIMYTNFTTFYPSIELKGWIFCRVSIAPEEKSAVSGFGAFSGVELAA
jgi:hypothetical protein